MTFHNVLLENRKNLTPHDSAQKLVNYALQRSDLIAIYRVNINPYLDLQLQDAKQRSRVLRNMKVNVMLPFLFLTFPAVYLIKGALHGCWSDLHPTNKLTLAFASVGKPFRLVYRPEIFLRDQQADYIELEKESIIKAQAGEHVEVTSPLVLWN